MCGIAGIITRDPRGGLAQAADAMSGRLAHRGPDDDGWLVCRRGTIRSGRGRPDDDPADAILVHRRLSIIDLSAAGHQPMSTADGRWHIVFNGEIYNYVELKEELARAGFVFRTKTDTEVLLAAITTWGVEALARLVGMFAFAVLDARQRTLLLARDFFGIKPLYYARHEGHFAFASEIKALLEVPWVARRVNPRTLYHYLRAGLVGHSQETLLADVCRLPPAHYLQIPLDKPAEGTLRQYWKVDLCRTAEMSFEEAARRLRELFLESVRLHLRSDVPVGGALSGGIDSSAIVCGSRAVGNRATEFHSFSFIADDSAVNEERWAEMASAAAGVTLHKIHIRPEELCDDLDRLIDVQDEPFASTSIYAQYRVFQKAREVGVKVLLDGQGADELLAGYLGYGPWVAAGLLRKGRLAGALKLIRGIRESHGVGQGRPLFRTCLCLMPGAAWRGARRVARWNGDGWLERSWFFARGVVDSRPSTPEKPFSLRHRLSHDLFCASLPPLLRYEDCNSMAFGLESRVPFLTPQLVQFVLSLPGTYLVSEDGVSKHVFRHALRGVIPQPILERRDKIGFATPELDWLRATRPWAQSVLQSDAARSAPFWDWAALRRRSDEILSGAKGFDFCLWRWINLARWVERFGVSWD